MNIKELRAASGMNRKQFAEFFGFPYRTLQSWELGDRKCPEYLLDLIEYKLEKEKEEIYLIYNDSVDDACDIEGYISASSEDEADKYCDELNKDNKWEWQDYYWQILKKLNK